MEKNRVPGIAIIGGGPGGLVLARILHVRGIDATVFEQEDGPSVRQQGGTLDIHEETGQYALNLAGLKEGFQQIARYEDQGVRIYDRIGALRFEDPDPSAGGRPEADRTELRDLLLGSLPPGSVRWGHKLAGARYEPGISWILEFANGQTGIYDFVVGADGAWSRVRPLVSDIRPVYTGITFVESGIDEAGTRHPEIANLVGSGKIFALSDSKALIAQRNSRSHIRVYAALRVPEDWSVTISGDISPETMRQRLLAEFSGWGENLRALIEKCDAWFVPRKLHVLPAGSSWAHRPGITLLGDAAHLMSPFSGEGANLAMRDAADLAVAFTDNGNLDDAIQSYETSIIERATPAAEEAYRLLQDALSPHGLESMLETMQAIHAEHSLYSS